MAFLSKFASTVDVYYSSHISRKLTILQFRENDMVREDEWKEASHQSMSKSFGKPKIRFAIEYDESSGDESDDGDEDVERQAKAIAPFNIYEAMKTPL